MFTLVLESDLFILNLSTSQINTKKVLLNI